jgi:hypothetical protein
LTSTAARCKRKCDRHAAQETVSKPPTGTLRARKGMAVALGSQTAITSGLTGEAK